MVTIPLNSEPISVSDVLFGSIKLSTPPELITYGGVEMEIGTMVLFSKLKWITNQVFTKLLFMAMKTVVMVLWT
jgi:hypothetical protein